MRIIILFLLTINIVLAQSLRPGSVQGWHLNKTAKDTIRAAIHDTSTVLRSEISDSLRVAADTTALKLLSGGKGAYAYLQGLSSSSAVGSGYFIATDSAYIENGVIAFAHPTTGMQWVREDWIKNKTNIFLKWAGVSTDETPISNSKKINKAIAVARYSSGGLIVENGTYLIEYRIILNWDGAFLISNNIGGTVFKRSSTFDVNIGVDTGNGIIMFKDVVGGLIKNITIDADFKITPGSSGTVNPLLITSCENIDAVNCKIQNITGHTYGIWVRYSKRVKIQKCYVSGDYNNIFSSGNDDMQEGIEVSQGVLDDILIEDCTVRNISNNGIYIYVGQSGATDKQTVNNVRVVHCDIDTVKSGIYIVSNYTTIDTSYLKNVKIEGNDIYRAYTYGIYAGTNALDYNNFAHIEIIKNHIENVSDSLDASGHHGKAIKVETAKFVQIKDNTIIDALDATEEASAAIYIDGTYYPIIEKNKIYNSGGNGITTMPSTIMPYIVDNYIISAYYSGIQSRGKGIGIIKSNDVINCNTSAGTTNPWLHCGIVLYNTDNYIITDNNIIDNRATPLHLWGIYSTASVDSTIFNNNNILGGTYYYNTLSSSEFNYNDTSSTFKYWGEVTPTAGTTETWVYTRKYTMNDKIIIVQTVGSNINPSVSTINYDKFRIIHDSALGTEKFVYLILE